MVEFRTTNEYYNTINNSVKTLAIISNSYSIQLDGCKGITERKNTLYYLIIDQ